MWDVIGVVAVVIAVGGLFWFVGRLVGRAQAGDRSYDSGNSGGITDAWAGSGGSDFGGGAGPGSD